MVIYLDDIAVYLKTKAEHVRHVTKVLQAIKNAGLRLKPEKSQFY